MKFEPTKKKERKKEEDKRLIVELCSIKENRSIVQSNVYQGSQPWTTDKHPQTQANGAKNRQNIPCVRIGNAWLKFRGKIHGPRARGECFLGICRTCTMRSSRETMQSYATLCNSAQSGKSCARAARTCRAIHVKSPRDLLLWIIDQWMIYIYITYYNTNINYW